MCPLAFHVELKGTRTHCLKADRESGCLGYHGGLLEDAGRSLRPAGLQLPLTLSTTQEGMMMHHVSSLMGLISNSLASSAPLGIMFTARVFSCSALAVISQGLKAREGMGDRLWRMQGVVKGYNASSLDSREYIALFQNAAGERQEEILQQDQVEELALNIFCFLAEPSAKPQVSLTRLDVCPLSCHLQFSLS